MLHLFNVGCVTTWGGETGSPPDKSTGDFCVSRDFYGGRGIARPPSSSQLPVSSSTLTLRTTEEEGLAHSLPPRDDGVFLGRKASSSQRQ